jgi:2,4-dienoyl-CoA reductase-like NADH-dependent reductase (Old Yellow Enzyme family)
MHSIFFSPITVGDIELSNRIVMAPMTRSRSDENGLVPDFAVDYYAQRADAGLIVTEATNISPQAIGYAMTPGYLVRPAGRRLEAGHRCGSRRRGQDRPAALAHGEDLPPGPAERGEAGRSFGDHS